MMVSVRHNPEKFEIRFLKHNPKISFVSQWLVAITQGIIVQELSILTAKSDALGYTLNPHSQDWYDNGFSTLNFLQFAQFWSTLHPGFKQSVAFLLR